MILDDLTRDNPHLSRSTNSLPEDPDSAPNDDNLPTFRGQACASTCTNDIPEQVAALVEASIAENTRRAYRSDFAHNGYPLHARRTR